MATEDLQAEAQDAAESEPLSIEEIEDYEQQIRDQFPSEEPF